MRKYVGVILIVILALSSLIFIGPVNSEITNPSVPEFTVKLFDFSHDILPTNTIDPFTGQTITDAGSHVEARIIEIKIKNEPFTPFVVTEGSTNWTAYFFYNIRWKGHYEQGWHEIYNPSDDFLPRNEGSETIYSTQGKYSSTDGLRLDTNGVYVTLPLGGEVDFQVEAMIGYTHRVVEGGIAPWYFFGETSGWSNTQTLTIDANAPTTTPNASTTSPALTGSTSPMQSPTATLQQTDSQSDVLFGPIWEQTAIIIFGIIIVILTSALILSRKRSAKQTQAQSNV